MNEEKIIHVHIYEPHQPTIFGKGKKSDRSELHIYKCTKCEECDALKNGTCINVSNVFGARCPFGRKQINHGFTPRAKGYYKQIAEWKKVYSDFYHKLKPTPKRIIKIADGWMMPYPYLNLTEQLPFESKGGVFDGGEPFILDCDLNKENFDKIINLQPRSLFGDVIKDYQKDVMPKIVKDIFDFYPEKFKEIASEKALTITKSYSYIGRKAYLKTVAPSKVKLSRKELWNWDGEKIYRKDEKFAIFEPVKWESCYASYIPKDDAVIEITENSQVTPETRFAD